MRRALTIAGAALAGCGTSADLVADLPEDTAFALVCTRTETRLWAPGAPLRFTRAGAEQVGVHAYRASASDLGLELDEEGLLVEAVDGEASWPLPRPDHALLLGAGEDAFVEASEPSCEAMVPQPRCPDLEVEWQTSLSSEFLDDQDINAVALLDDTILFSTESERAPFRDNRLYLARQGELVQVTLPPGYPDGWEDDLRPFASPERFIVVATTSTRVAVFSVAMDGRVERLVEDRSLPRYSNRTAYWPGSDRIVQLVAGEGRIMSLALTSSATAQFFTEPVPPGGPCSEPGSSIQLESPSSGVAHFPGSFPYRFHLDGRMELIADVRTEGSRCESAYARMPSGAELITFNDDLELGDDHLLWRARSSDPWTLSGTIGSLFETASLGGRVVARDRTSAYFVMLDHFAGRPDIAPRVCSKLDFVGVQRSSVTGDRAVVAARMGFSSYALLVVRMGAAR